MKKRSPKKQAMLSIAGKGKLLALVLPSSAEERQQANLTAFAPEWTSSLDRTYDALGRR